MTKVLVVGCGDLGHGVAQYFVANGADVTGIRRLGTAFPEGVTGITQDITTLPVNDWPNTDLVYLIMTPSGRTAEAYHAAYVDTAQALVDGYQGRSTLPQVVFVSSTSVYGENCGEWIDDSSPATASSPTAEKILQAESLLVDQLSAIAVRCSGIYGPRRYRLLDSVRQGAEWGVNQWTNRIHRDDVVRALCVVGEQALAGQALPTHILASDGHPVSMWEVKAWLSARLQVSPSLPDRINLDDYWPSRGKRIVGSVLKELGWSANYSSYVSGYESMLSDYLEELA